MSAIQTLIQDLNERSQIKLELTDPLILELTAREQLHDHLLESIRQLLAQQQEKLDDNARRVLTSIETDLVTLTNAAASHIHNQMVNSRTEMITELDEYFQEKTEKLRSVFNQHQNPIQWDRYLSIPGIAIIGFFTGVFVALQVKMH